MGGGRMPSETLGMCWSFPSSQQEGLPTTTIRAEKAPKSEMITSSHLDPECEGAKENPEPGLESWAWEERVQAWRDPSLVVWACWGAVRRGNGSWAHLMHRFPEFE